MSFHARHLCDLPASQLPVRCYAYALLHFLRWWWRQPGVDVMRFSAEAAVPLPLPRGDAACACCPCRRKPSAFCRASCAASAR